MGKKVPTWPPEVLAEWEDTNRRMRRRIAELRELQRQYDEREVRRQRRLQRLPFGLLGRE